MTDGPVNFRVVDVPAIVVHPDPATANGRLALWMHFLGGTKERMVPALERLAASGYTAVSFDSWQHGERALEPVPELMGRVFGAFRSEMWPILGRSVLDAVAVIDAARRTFGLDGDVVAGGVSMGGDVAVALAGVDRRVARVAAVVATPDWTRPGMTVLDDPSTVIDQGEPTALAQWFYDQLDPMTHLDRYAGGPPMVFDVGGADRHVPPENAEAFAAALGGTAVTVRRYDGLDHFGAARDEAVTDAARAFLAEGRR